MRKRLIFTSIISMLLLIGCSNIELDKLNNNNFDNTNNNNSSSDNNDSTDTTDEEPVDPIHINESFDFKILSSNDIHGQVDAENPTNTNGRAGIGKYFTYAKQIKDNNENVLLFDQGDTFQGSIYSNENRGNLISKAMAYTHYDARAIGNHDFDWGIEPLIKNKNVGYGDYVVPTLGANIYDYDFSNKEFLSSHCDNICDSSTICEFNNGFKVGVIGTIGSSQITSICTKYVSNLNFKDHIETIKSEATKLRNKGCHFVVSLHHGSVSELLGQDLTNYIDLALCAHTHQLEEELENGVLFSQAVAYTEYLQDINFSFDASTQKASLSNHSFIDSSTIYNAVTSVDPIIESMITEAKDEINNNSENNPDKVVANNVSGYFGYYYQNSSSNISANNLMAKAIYDTAINEGYSIDLAYVNQLRHALYKGSWTYANIYQAAPFDNEVYIMDVSYDDMVNEVAKYNYICKENGKTIKLEQGKTYKIAVIDYLACHTNENRQFDYFKSMNNYWDNINSITKLSKNYRNILADWLIKNYSNSEELNPNNFTSSISDFNKSDLVY